MKLKNDGTTTVAARRRYLSEKRPDATTQNAAKTYGGALRAWALAAVKPMFLTMVGRAKANPYTAIVLQMKQNDRIHTCGDW